MRVFGAVNEPGVYEPSEDMDLLDLLVLAGGEAPEADLSNVQIMREDKVINYNLNELLLQKEKDESIKIPEVQNGDLVRVGVMERAGYKAKTTENMARIIGAVIKPGGYEVTEDMDLLDLLAAASGETPDADLSNVQIFRNKRVLKINLDKLLRSGVKRRIKPPKILKADIVRINFLVKEDYAKEENFYVTGEVQSPGEYELDQGLTVLQAIALAGGLTEWADSDDITIVRMVDGKQENIPFNYYKGVAGKLHELNVYLQADDVVVVP